MKFVQIHMLVSYPASNLNRDDLGRPKTVRIGETTRLRISSQSLKRAWRTSEVMNSSFPELGIRTNKLSEAIEEALVSGISLVNLVKGNNNVTRNLVDKKVAKEYGEKIDDVFRSKGGKNTDSEDSVDESEKDGKKKKVEKKKQIFHYSDEEIRKVDSILADISDNKKPDISDLLTSEHYPVDIAMFGRMVANDNRYTCEAAVQVAHAFTVHKAVIEEDYFTAVDDLNTAGSTGAGHIDETAFGAGLFYTYICVDFELLAKNLGSETKAKSALKTLLTAATTVSPSGKQNAFASRAYASFVMIEKGDKQPRSLASSFLKPIHGEDLLDGAISALKKTQANMDKVFGKCYDECYILDVMAGEGTLDDAGAFLE